MQEVFRLLRLFNEKSLLLRESRFTKQACHPDAGFKISFGQDNPGGSVSRTGPDDAAIREFALTLRFFIQDNEACSLKNVASLYQKLPIAEDKKIRVQEVRRKLNESLDSASSLRLKTTDISNRRIMDIFIYGSIAHANSEKAKVLDTWKAHTLWYELAYDRFTDIMFAVMRAVAYIEGMNTEVLKELAHLEPALGPSVLLP